MQMRYLTNNKNRTIKRHKRRLFWGQKFAPIKMKRHKYCTRFGQFLSPTSKKLPLALEEDKQEIISTELRGKLHNNNNNNNNNVMPTSRLVGCLFSVLLLIGERFAQVTPMITSALSDYDGATFYKAPVGSRIRIACNASYWNDDSVSLVLWFKSSSHHNSSSDPQQPVYTLDARQRPLSSGAARHLVADSWRGRAKFILPNVPATSHPASSRQNDSNANNANTQVPYLDLGPLEAEDQAEYRCRVDYRSRPRENFLIVLFVLGRPAPAIQWLKRPSTTIRSNELDSTTSSVSVIDDTYLTLHDFVALQAAPNGLEMDKTMISENYTPKEKEKDNDNNNESSNFGLANNKSDDNNQQQKTINDQLVSEWKSWPEFEFFSLKFMSTSEDEVKFRDELSGRQKNGAPLGRHNQQASKQLLDFQPEEKMTTSVNVLHLDELTRDHLIASGWPQQHQKSSQSEDIVASRTQKAQSASLAQLECRASNLHYDLRSLIKLFAPPSLVPSASPDLEAGESSAHSPSQLALLSPRALSRSSAGYTSASRQLVEAMERSLVANLRPSLQQVASGAALSSNATIANSQEHGEGHQEPLKQIKPDGSQQQKVHAKTSETVGGDFATAAKWQSVIQQQLVRPHKLSEQVLAPASVSANGQVAQQTTTLSKSNELGLLAKSKLIALDAYLRPLDVKIYSGQRPLTAGQVHEFTCVSSGSRPPATLVWLINGQRLEATDAAAKIQIATSNKSSWITTTGSSADSFQQSSKLALRVERANHQARLSCRAVNERALAKLAGNSTILDNNNNNKQLLEFWQLEDSMTLSVQYSPSARLELGNKMLSERLREGSDIYFECLVDAQPQAREVTWLHNEKPINESQQQHPGKEPPTRLIVSNKSLVLQRVRLDQSGQYACMATNSEGVGVSNRIELRVMHEPICLGGSARPTTSESVLVGQQEMDITSLPKEETMSNFSSDKQRRQQQQHYKHHGLAALAAKWDRNQMATLELGASKTSIGSHLSFQCDWLAEPAERMEFTWYLNNSANERRVLFSTSLAETAKQNDVDAGAEQTKPALDKERQKQVGKLATHSSELNFRLESPNDFGQLFCLAKNELGQQKRACVYNLEMEEYGLQPEVEPFACLPFNVTSESAWIGCEFPTELANSNGGYQFDVIVYSLDHLHKDPSTATSFSRESNVRNLKFNRQTTTRQLEANLSSSQFDEPLFAVTNLRPMTSYAFEIQPKLLDSMPIVSSDRLPAASIVQLTTSASGQDSEFDKDARPSIRRVTEPQRSELLAAALVSASRQSSNNKRTTTAAAASTIDSSRSLTRQQQTGGENRGEEAPWTWLNLLGSFLGRSADLQDGSLATQNGVHLRKIQAHLIPSQQVNKSGYQKLLTLDSSTLIVCLSLISLVTLIGLFLVYRFIVSHSIWRDKHSRGTKRLRASRNNGCTKRMPPKESSRGSTEKLSSFSASRPRTARRGDGGSKAEDEMMPTLTSSSSNTSGSVIEKLRHNSQSIRSQNKSGNNGANMVLSAAPLISRTTVSPNCMLSSSQTQQQHFSSPLTFSDQQQQQQQTQCSEARSCASNYSLPRATTNSINADSALALTHQGRQAACSYGTMRLVNRQATNHNDQLAPMFQSHGHGLVQQQQQQQTGPITRSRSSVCFDSLSSPMLLGGGGGDGCSDIAAAIQPRLALSNDNHQNLTLPGGEHERQQQQQQQQRRLISDANFVFTPSEQELAPHQADSMFVHLSEQCSMLPQTPEIRQAGCRCPAQDNFRGVQHANEQRAANSYLANRSALNGQHLHSLMSSTATNTTDESTTTTTTTDYHRQAAGNWPSSTNPTNSDNLVSQEEIFVTGGQGVDFIELLPTSSLQNYSHEFDFDLDLIQHHNHHHHHHLHQKMLLSDHLLTTWSSSSAIGGQLEQQNLVSSLSTHSGRDQIVSSSTPPLSLSSPVGVEFVGAQSEAEIELDPSNLTAQSNTIKRNQYQTQTQLTSILKHSQTQRCHVGQRASQDQDSNGQLHGDGDGIQDSAAKNL